MIDLLGLDAHDLAWYQMASRAVIVFVSALIVLRLAGMRAFGAKTPFDVVLTMTIGSVLSRCITGHYPFVATLAGALTLVLCHRAVAFITCKWQACRRVAEGSPSPLVQHGKKVNATLRRYAIHDDDLARAMRESNVKSLSEVEEMWYEINGKITVITKRK